MSKNHKHLEDLLLLTLFITLIIIQTWVPFLGYISIPGIAITIVPITVTIATVTLGTKRGAAVGFMWGLMSLLRAWFTGNPFEKLIFISPFVSILPRVLTPLILGALIGWLKRSNIQVHLQNVFIGLAGSLLNTILVLTAIALFKGQDYAAFIEGANMDNLWLFLSALVVTNGIPEAIAGGVITPLILRSLRPFIKKH